jgi:tetratricopeptide (TPR) repeat protein
LSGDFPEEPRAGPPPEPDTDAAAGGRTGGDPDATRTATAAPLLTRGDLLAGRYRIRERIGSGGMGLVYRARDERLGIDVAVKILRPEHTADGEVAARFTRELLLARQVSHRHVVRIHDLGEDGDLRFLTMDLVQGRTLKQVLAEEGAFEPERAARVAAQLAAALRAAHRQGVVHRDLKPSNVLLDASGDAYVTDFGVARSAAASQLTSTGGIVGTPAYLSPEQARGDPADGRSDVYSLGLLLHEMLAGEPAFPDGTWPEVLGRRVSGHPRDLRQRAPGAPRWLCDVVARCLERDPEQRYADAGELAADLAAGRRPRGSKGLLGRPRPTAWRVALAAAALAVMVAAGYLGWHARHADKPPAAAGAPRLSVAVLPLADETGSGWASSAAAEMLAGSLEDSAALRVVDSLRVLRTVQDLGLPAGPLPAGELRRLGELLGADRVVAARVVSVPGRVRLDGRVAEIEGDGLLIDGIAAEAPELLAALDAFAERLRQRLQVETNGSGPPPRLSADPEAMAAYAEGLEALVAGDSLTAAPALEAAVEADPGFAAAWVRLAGAYEALGHDERALAASRRAVEALPPQAGALVYEARAGLASLEGDTERAAGLLAELVERFPNDAEARVALAEARAGLGRFADAAGDLERVTAGDPNHPRAWYLLGKYAILSGDSRRAADDYLVRALVIHNRLHNRQGQADVTNALGLALLNLGQLDPARQRFGEAVELRREIGDRRGVAAVLSNLGLVDTQRGDYEGARHSFEESLQIRREIGDRDGVASVENYLGVLEEEQGSYRVALDHFRRALALRRELGDGRAYAESLNNVGYAYYLLGDHDNAAVYWQRALDLYRNGGNREGELLARQNLGLLELARGRWDGALAAFLDTLETSRELGLRAAEAVSLGQLGRVAQFQGRFGAALGSYAQALERVAAIEDPRGLVEFHLLAAEAALEVGLGDGAGDHLDEAREWLDRGGNREQRAEAARLAAEVAIDGGDAAGAERWLAAALDSAQRSGSEPLLLSIEVSRARADLLAGHSAVAIEAAAASADRARQAGLRVLELRALEVMAEAQLASGRAEQAASTAQRALDAAAELSPYGRAFRLHRLLALARSAAGRPSAETAWRAAAEEIERLRGDLRGEAAAAFALLPAVVEIEGRDG